MIAAGIVIYFPNEERFIDNLQSIIKQVSKVYIYDNGSGDTLKVNLKKIFSDKITIIGDGNNIGLSKALNSIMEFATEERQEWLITLDQDSICPDDLIKKYKYYVQKEDIAIICPQVRDKRRVYMKPIISEDIVFVEKCITSASLTRISAWKSVGGFDNKLFIDLIDDDFCKKLIINGWKIVRVNNIILDQEFGNIQLKSPWVVKIILYFAEKIKDQDLRINISKLTYKKNVDPRRVYYTNRNIIYLNEKYKKDNGISYKAYHCKSYLGFMFTFNLPSFIRGRQKIKILKAIITGIRDGRKLKAEVIDV